MLNTKKEVENFIATDLALMPDWALKRILEAAKAEQERREDECIEKGKYLPITMREQLRSMSKSLEHLAFQSYASRTGCSIEFARRVFKREAKILVQTMKT